VYTQDEHGINLADVDPDAVHIIERLVAAGFETYIVGGAVRDLVLGKKPKDFDIASAASPNQIKKLFRNARIIGNRFRLVHVAIGSKLFEVSTFRSIKDGMKSNVFGTIEEDVLRRDFSFNALFYDPQKQLVVDYVGGMKDIRKKIVRPVIPLKTIFTDDPVRMIRAVKYGVTTGFKLPFFLRLKIQRQSHLLSSVSPSRLTEEILKIIRSSSASKIVENLESYGLYQYLQPNASKLMKEKSKKDGISQNFRVKYLQSLAALNHVDVMGENLAALIRDYLETVIQWDGPDSSDVSNMENYKKAFSEARHFVLPMNPPRFELDCAVRLIFKAHHISVRHPLFTEKGVRFPPQRKAEKQPSAEQSIETNALPEEERKTKRRRHRQKKQPPS
jgi:poly(A) polymerase